MGIGYKATESEERVLEFQRAKEEKAIGFEEEKARQFQHDKNKRDDYDFYKTKINNKHSHLMSLVSATAVFATIVTGGTVAHQAISLQAERNQIERQRNEVEQDRNRDEMNFQNEKYKSEMDFQNKRYKSELILEAIKAAGSDRDQATQNILLLNRAGLLSLSSDTLELLTHKQKKLSP